MTKTEDITKKEMFDRLSPCDTGRPYVFVSYSSRDWFRVCTDVCELQRRGCNVWIDEKNLDKTKDSWKEDALGAIRSYCCAFVLFYVSEASLTSGQCLAELEETFSRETADNHWGDPVQFVCIDTEHIGDIQKARLRIRDRIHHDAGLNVEEKETRSRALTAFLRDIFNGNSERIRIHPADEPDRRREYYPEILETLPEETRSAPPPDGPGTDDPLSGEEYRAESSRSPAEYAAAQEDLLQRIGALTSLPQTDETAQELRKLYRAARTNAAEHGLDPKCWADYVWFLCSRKEYDDGITEAEALLALLKDRESTAPSVWFRTCRALVQMYESAGRREDALRFGTEILPVLRELGPGQNAARLLCNLAELYGKEKRYDMAEPLSREALGIWGQLASDHPNLRHDQAWTAQNAAQFCLENGHTGEAETLFTESLAIRRALAEEDPENARTVQELAWSCCNLADLYKKTQQYEKAAALYEEALAIRRTLAGKDPEKYNAELIWTCGSLAFVYRRLGRNEEANALKTEADSLRGGN